LVQEKSLNRKGVNLLSIHERLVYGDMLIKHERIAYTIQMNGTNKYQEWKNRWNDVTLKIKTEDIKIVDPLLNS